MAISTVGSSVDAALNLKNKYQNTYLGIGKSTPWTNENLPPQPDKNTTGLSELVGMKRMDRVSICRPLASGETTNNQTVSYNNQTWVLIADADAASQKATYVYYECMIRSTELPLGQYRQVGIYTGVQPNSGITKANLLPSEIANLGLLEFFDNRLSQTRAEGVNIIERFIVSVGNT